MKILAQIVGVGHQTSARKGILLPRIHKNQNVHTLTHSQIYMFSINIHEIHPIIRSITLTTEILSIYPYDTKLKYF